MKRIAWIDWAKALAVITVVFCHLPQSQEWFYYRYLQTTIITVFFFLSGYLKKDRDSWHESWQKYWWGLLIPYFIYNALVYPYWFVRFYLKSGVWPDLFQAVKPIVGALLMEHESSWAEPLDGALWYLPAIMLMHLLTDALRRTRYLHQAMLGLCVVCFFVYAANKYWLFAPQLVPMDFPRRLPFYFLGYVMGRQHRCLSKPCSALVTFQLSILSFLLSIGFFYWHLLVMDTQFMLHTLLFFPVCLFFLSGVVFACRSLEGHTPQAITNLSIGTLVIIGLHQMLIGVVNQVVARFSPGWSPLIGYHWYEALPISLMLTALLYPIILWAQHHWPILIGKKTGRSTSA